MNKCTRILAAAAVAALAGAASAQTPLPSSFTYQGELTLNGQAVDDTGDFRVRLWNAATDGDVVGSTIELTGVEVSGGVFALDLDFGSEIFNGDAFWLEIDARTPSGSGQYETLSPRQLVSATPYALQTRGMFVDDGGHATFGPGGVGNRNGFGKVVNIKGGVNSAVKFSGTDIADEWWLGMCSDGNLCVFHSGPALGKMSVPMLEIRGGGDIAEPFNVSAAGTGSVIEPGMLVAIDPERPGELVLASEAYDTKVAGIISGANGVNPGMVLYQEDSVANGEHPVALTGRVWAYCDADVSGAIEPGDLLTSSDIPGYAMKATDRDRAAGAIIGKAMSSLESGRGVVFVLVSLQ